MMTVSWISANYYGPDANDEEIKQHLLMAFGARPKDGFEAEGKRKNHLPVSESMSTIGG